MCSLPSVRTARTSLWSWFYLFFYISEKEDWNGIRAVHSYTMVINKLTHSYFVKERPIYTDKTDQ